MNTDQRAMLRYFRGALAYRTQKALRDAPADFTMSMRPAGPRALGLFCLALLVGLGAPACESDERKLVRLRNQAETTCRGLHEMRLDFDSAFGYWMRMDPDTLVPIMAAYGDSLKYWYDRCELAVREYNTLRQSAGTGEEMTMPAAP